MASTPYTVSNNLVTVESPAPMVGASATDFVGFFGTTPVVKQTVSGLKGSNAALASLMAALVAYGLVIDTTGA